MRVFLLAGLVGLAFADEGEVVEKEAPAPKWTPSPIHVYGECDPLGPCYRYKAYIRAELGADFNNQAIYYRSSDPKEKLMIAAIDSPDTLKCKDDQLNGVPIWHEFNREIVLQTTAGKFIRFLSCNNQKVEFRVPHGDPIWWGQEFQCQNKDNTELTEFDKAMLKHIDENEYLDDVIKHVVHPNACDSCKDPALHKAIWMQQVDNVRELVKHGASVNAIDSGKQTPLHIAADVGNADIAKIIFDYAPKNDKGEPIVDVHATTEFGATALHYAAHRDQDDIVDLLLDYGADINAEDMFERTPFYRAIMDDNTRFKAAQLLHRRCADIDAHPEHGKKPIDLLKDKIEALKKTKDTDTEDQFDFVRKTTLIEELETALEDLRDTKDCSRNPTPVPTPGPTYDHKERQWKTVYSCYGAEFEGEKQENLQEKIYWERVKGEEGERDHFKIVNKNKGNILDNWRLNEVADEAEWHRICVMGVDTEPATVHNYPDDKFGAVRTQKKPLCFRSFSQRGIAGAVYNLRSWAQSGPGAWGLQDFSIMRRKEGKFGLPRADGENDGQLVSGVSPECGASCIEREFEIIEYEKHDIPEQDRFSSQFYNGLKWGEDTRCNPRNPTGNFLDVKYPPHPDAGNEMIYNSCENSLGGLQLSMNGNICSWNSNKYHIYIQLLVTPTLLVTAFPTLEPTHPPTNLPTFEPTNPPTEEPTDFPTFTPTPDPTDAPTEEPTPEPTVPPTDAPTAFPTATDKPTEEPTSEPTLPPTAPPKEPSMSPTKEPEAPPTTACVDAEPAKCEKMIRRGNLDCSDISITLSCLKSCDACELGPEPETEKPTLEPTNPPDEKPIHPFFNIFKPKPEGLYPAPSCSIGKFSKLYELSCCCKDLNNDQLLVDNYCVSGCLGKVKKNKKKGTKTCKSPKKVTSCGKIKDEPWCNAINGCEWADNSCSGKPQIEKVKGKCGK